MYYKGKYKLKNPNKYIGDTSNIVYRSHWERQCFRWCDDNPKVKKWSSEELVIPYRCATDNKVHRYFVDLLIKFENGKVYCIEIKPKSQTTLPKKGKKNTKRFLNETLTYAKNESKWKAAKSFCDDKGWHFAIWTEDTLKSIGIKLLVKK